MEHFKILPTDDRFKKLTIDQMEILYYNFLNTPSDEAQRKYYLDKISNKDKVDSIPEDYAVSVLGYTKEDIAKIKGELNG